jgi:uncharacterized protein (TIGR03435 family)
VTNTLGNLALAVSGSFELSIVVKATFVAASAVGGIAVARRLRASRRHLVLAAAFGVLLALPLVAALATPVTVAVSSASQSAPVSFMELSVDPTEAFRAAFTDRRATLVGNEAPDRGWAPSPIVLVRTTWIAGALLCLLPIIMMTWRVRLLRRSGAPWQAGEAFAAGLARSIGIRRRVGVLVHEGVEAPMTCGIWRPAILLPRDASEWSEDDLQRALLHELEHVRRADWPMHIAARATCAIYWFHPLVWMAWRRLHLEAERACDDGVACRTDRNAYAAQLVRLAQRLSADSARPVLAMAGRGDLSHRVGAVLDDAQTRGPAGRWTTLAIILLGVFIVQIASLRAVRAQTTTTSAAAAPRLTFEVASIKPNRSGPPDSNGNPAVLTPVSGGGFKATNSTLESIIRYVYGMPTFGAMLREDQLIGGPDWSRTDRFDIEAKAARDVPRDDIFRMVQALLEERFRLVVSTEPRERDTYALMLARTDGRLGPDLRRSDEADCTARREAARAPGSTLLPPAIKPRSLVGTTTSGVCSPITGLVPGLQRAMRTTVVDKTGLAGLWDYRLTYVTERTQPPVPGLAPLPRPANVEEAPPLVTALQEQLGLKLEKQRSPVDVLVIKSVQRPTEN